MLQYKHIRIRITGYDLKVLILGGSGQTGSYLCDLYANSGHEVFNASRTPSRYSRDNVRFLEIVVDEFFDVSGLIEKASPDLVINLLSLSSVSDCERNPGLSQELNWLFVERCLKALRSARDHFGRDIHFVQASSSEMYSGYAAETVINENSMLNPATTYGKHKARAHEAILDFNSSFGGARAAILFNHESPRRDSKFVSKKIINGLVDIQEGKIGKIELGNINTRRDWGFAADYAQGIMILGEKSSVSSLVFASGKLYSVKDFVKHAAKTIGISEINDRIFINQDLIRNVENDGLIGDSTMARTHGWIETLDFHELIGYMAEHEIANRKVNWSQ
jgi:GDPmannose 4,6-dehydratase